MSFLESDEQRVQLLRLVDAGVSVASAAETVGVTRQRAYELLRRAGRPVRGPHAEVTTAQRDCVLAILDGGGTVNKAKVAAGVTRTAVLRILAEGGRVLERRPQGKPEARAKLLELLANGMSVARAARLVGVNERTARDWRDGIRKTNNKRIFPNGVVAEYSPANRYTVEVKTEPAVISARYLSLDDRLAIADGLINKLTFTQIGERIGKHKSTVSREVNERRVNGLYLPHQAHKDAAAARARPKQSKLVVNQPLRTQVEQGLSRKLSPEQIAGRLRKDFPDDESMRVSHETIYQALYCQARGGLKRELQKALRTGRARRKPQRQPDQRTHRFIDEMIMISERPAEVEDRAVPGHWEGDLIMGEGNRTAIGTLVERTTRYTLLVHLPEGQHDAETLRDGLLATIKQLPAHLRGSLTWDQGSEMARHKQFSLAANMAVYFCDPASPWQRGSNENTNGLLRQYFPKGSDLSIYGPEDLEHVAQELNGRPRKTLGWDTPAERLRDLLTTEK